MTNLAQFAFQDNQVRVLLLGNTPWFTAKDVAFVLGYSEPARMLQLVDEEDKQVINPQKLDSIKMVESFGDNTFKLSVINESGLYSVIFNSTKPEAKIFKKWVTSEVLPRIRQTGSYQAKPKSEIELLIESAQQLLKLQQEQERLKLEQQLQSQKLAEIEFLTHQHDSEIDRIFNPNGHYFAVMGYYSNRSLGAISLKQASAIGKKATAYCKKHNIHVDKMPDPRFGWVNTYPENVIAMFVDNCVSAETTEDLTTNPIKHKSIQEIWRTIIDKLEPLTTRELLRMQCTLIEFDGKIARIGISSENLLKLVQGKLTNLQAAFTTTFQRQIKVTLEVASVRPEEKK